MAQQVTYENKIKTVAQQVTYENKIKTKGDRAQLPPSHEYASAFNHDVDQVTTTHENRVCFEIDSFVEWCNNDKENMPTVELKFSC